MPSKREKDSKKKDSKKRHEGFFRVRKKTPPPTRAIPSKKEKESGKRPKPGELVKEAEGEEE